MSRQTILFLLATAASWAMVRMVGYWARRRAVLAMPNDRGMHSRPTPVGGGLAIVAVAAVGLAASLAAGIVPVAGAGVFLPAYGLGAAMVMLVSWIDDLRQLPTWPRLATHGLAAGAVIAAGSWWREVVLPGCGPVELGSLGIVATFVWIVGLTNAYNFMDGIDGIAGAVAVVAGLGWFVLGQMTAQPAIGLLGLLVAAGSLGFLAENWSPARIFMGDVGSASLGFTFAVMAVIAAQGEPRLALAGVLVVWPLVFDAGLTFTRRLILREGVFRAHRTHLYQRLVLAGWPPAVVASVYAGFSLVGLILAVRFVRDPVTGGKPIPLVIGLLAAGWWWFVRQQGTTPAVAGSGHPVASDEKPVIQQVGQSR